MAKKKKRKTKKARSGPATLTKTGTVTKKYRSAATARSALKKVCAYDPSAVVHQGRKVVAACGSLSGSRRRRRR
jgi:hypothetical protein